jgi:hypothetical protein
MDFKHMAFLQQVQAYIEKYPDVGAYVSDFVARGIEASRLDALHRAADMEVALSVAIAKRWPGREGLILSKLKKWNGRSSVPWDDAIELLEDKLKPSNAKIRGG